MTEILARLLRRVPVGWLQLTHNRTRMLAALAGVAFANVLVFVQLGLMGALNGTVDKAYIPFRSDVVIVASDANTLSDGSPISRRLMYSAAENPKVAATAPFFISKIDWTRLNKPVTSLNIYALPLEAKRFIGKDLLPLLPHLTLPDQVLIDRLTRGEKAADLAKITPENPTSFEMRGVTLTAVGNFSLGSGFSADGTIFTSDQTFLHIFSSRSSEMPNLLLIDAVPGTNLPQLVSELSQQFKDEPVHVKTYDDFRNADRKYQTTKRPTGVVFGFGVFIGILVGLVIVYQVLASDVADHLREYATFKAMGYRQRFFLSVIFEEATILAILGFIPGFLLAQGFYFAMATATGLPITMTSDRAFSVFIGTLLSCAISGALATRKLNSADPAELF